jgi:indolepyruvate decarboxylase
MSKTVERLLCTDPESYYNDLAKWHYHELPEALGCEGWLTRHVTTCGELDDAISKAESCGTGAYIEVVTDRYADSESIRQSIRPKHAYSPADRKKVGNDR